jgi:hypothetical protein
MTATGLECLRLTRLRRHEHRLAAGSLDGLPRLGQLDLLGAFVGDEERDATVLQFVGH